MAMLLLFSKWKYLLATFKTYILYITYIYFIRIVHTVSVLCYGFVFSELTQIFLWYFVGIKANIRLPHYQWRHSTEYQITARRKSTSNWRYSYNKIKHDITVCLCYRVYVNYSNSVLGFVPAVMDCAYQAYLRQLLITHIKLIPA